MSSAAGGIPVRVIARLDVKGPNVIKGIHLEGLRVVGQPGPLARRYYDEGADEIIFMDVVASLYNRNNILPVIEQAACETFVPLTAGGGLRRVEDIVAALRSGADKVAINTAATQRPDFIREAAQALGSQCIVVSIEAKSRGPGRWEVLVDNGRQKTGVDVLDWAGRAAQLGAGEILITSVDMEGTRKGFDRELLRAVRKSVDIPIIASGGAGTATHVAEAFEDGVDAVACASLFHFGTCPIRTLKTDLASRGVAVRL
ncbi:MAG: imidazole glycerol phosphate synthase subunit HisF [Hyphomicrobium sp.]